MNAPHVAEASRDYLTQPAPPLVRHFDLLAGAPQGVARLRELILSLAVRGKLVPQDPADEPASVLLERIRAEKDRHVAEGAIRRSKPLSAIDGSAKPFEIPVPWEWARLGELTLLITDGTHHTPTYRPAGIPFISVKDIDGRTVSFDDCRYISEEEHRQINARCNPENGDILLCRIGTLGRPTVVETDRPFSLFVSVGLLKLPRTVKMGSFLHCVMRSPLLKNQYQEIKAGGSHTNKLNLGDIPRLKIPLPPLSEQTRIVAKVEELMSLCDLLEEKGRLEAEQHGRLVATLFDSLASAESAHELAESWQRIFAHFDLLLDRPEAVDVLEQTVLQLAVRGLLVPQDPADEPASCLLERIRLEKDRMIAAGTLKRDKPWSPTASFFELPESWEWSSFPALCTIGGGATPSKSNVRYWDGDIPWVSPKDMKVDIISDAEDHVSSAALLETRLPLIPAGSLLLVVRGMILAHSFPVGVTTVEVTINQDMKSLTPIQPCITPYLSLVCKGFKRDLLALVARSTHGTCKLESEKLFGFQFGLPPLAEQSRIVTRVEELRRLCADLRGRLSHRKDIQRALSVALVEQAAA